MQAALQPWVDNAISKTINVPASLDFDDFRAIYFKAYQQGLKGCTTYRPNAVTGAVLERSAEQASGSHCCDLEREND
jgi:ribonucleoside-diphosphate reductase alpha chain